MTEWTPLGITRYRVRRGPWLPRLLMAALVWAVIGFALARWLL